MRRGEIPMMDYRSWTFAATMQNSFRVPGTTCRTWRMRIRTKCRTRVCCIARAHAIIVPFVAMSSDKGFAGRTIVNAWSSNGHVCMTHTFTRYVTMFYNLLSSSSALRRTCKCRINLCYICGQQIYTVIQPKPYDKDFLESDTSGV